MKKILQILLIIPVCIFAQEREQYVTYQDFGYHKQPQKIVKATYEIIDGKPVKQAQEITTFSKDGTISGIDEVLYLDNNATVKTTYEYKNKKLVKERTELSDKKHLQRTTTYQYDKNGQLSEKMEKNDDGYFTRYDYKYDNGNRTEIKVDFNSESVLTQQLFYNDKNELLWMDCQETTGTPHVYRWTEAYWNGEKIFEIDEDHKSTFLYFKDPTIETQYSVFGDEVIGELKGILEEFKKQPSSATENLNQLMSNYYNKSDQLRINKGILKKQNEHGDLIFRAEVSAPFQSFDELDFMEITYSDGTKSGSTEFSQEIYDQVSKMLDK